MKPTIEQLNDSKWWNENAPAWADTYGLVGGGYPVFANAKDYTHILGRQRGKVFAFGGPGDFWSRESLKSVIKRPTAKQWNGPQDGLPPVGTKCLYSLYLDKWEEVEIIYHFDNTAARVAAFLYKSCGGVNVSQAIAEHFKPLISQAEKEREDACDKMYAIMTSCKRAGNRSDMAEALYDAGYRLEGKQ